MDAKCVRYARRKESTTWQPKTVPFVPCMITSIGTRDPIFRPTDDDAGSVAVTLPRSENLVASTPATPPSPPSHQYPCIVGVIWM